MIWLFTQVVEGEVCSKHNPNDYSVPLCPEKGTMLNETFPVSMAFVSVEEESPEFIKKFSQEILTAGNGKKHPTIFLSGPKKECLGLRKHLEEKGVVGKGEAKGVVVCSEKTKLTWQQDFMQGHFNPSTGHPVVKINENYDYGKGKHQFKNLGPIISQTCSGVQVEPVRLIKNRDGSSFGNFEGIPPHFCVVGSSDFNKAEFNKMSKKVCGNADIIKAPTSFLKVGHTDEIMKTVPSKEPPPCNFRVLIADQSLGMELLEKSKGPLFDTHTNPVVSDYLKKFDFAEKICLEAISLRQKSRDYPEETKSTSFLNNFIKKIFSVNKAYGGLGVVNDLHPCEGVTGKEFVSGLRAYRDNGEFSRIIDKKLDLFAGRVKARIKNKFPQCLSPDFPVIRVPTLYYSPWSLSDAESDEEKPENIGGSVFPSLTNGLAIGSKLIFSNQIVAPYNNFLKKIASKVSLSHSTINTNFAHKRHGNLHCASNLIRYCKPRRN